MRPRVGLKGTTRSPNAPAHRTAQALSGGNYVAELPLEVRDGTISLAVDDSTMEVLPDGSLAAKDQSASAATAPEIAFLVQTITSPPTQGEVQAMKTNLNHLLLILNSMEKIQALMLLMNTQQHL